ncbi:TPA: hypothetical protein DEB72_00265 [Patescibacteria group bacterium]|nr:hypothetical protein [Patescibacteria group bacterium]
MIPALSGGHPLRVALGAKGILAKEDAAQKFTYLGLGRDLIKMVHALHSSRACANRLSMPLICSIP